MAGSITEAVSALDEQMFNNFMRYAQLILDSWRECLQSGNNGQKSIIMEHLLPAAYEHVGEAAMYWPRGAQPSDYAEACYGSYDTDVVERAFSNTIDGIMGELQDLITEADEWQFEHEDLVAILGDSFEPHSVYPPFEGAGGMVTQPSGAGREGGVPSFIEF